MRKIGLFVACMVMLLMSVAWVEGQQEKKRAGGGFQFGGGFQGGGRQDPISLLTRQDVKKELEISDEQTEKLPAEVMVAIGKVLNEKQFKRFKQIELQKRGNGAFKDETIQKDLKVTDEQKKSLISIVEDAEKELAEARKSAFGGGGAKGKGGEAFKALQEKQATVAKESKEKIYGVLTKDQRKAWREMIGEEFKFETPAFGGGAFGKKKTDDK